MKKFLSLALALVMTMSLVTVGAGAKDFTDDSKIQYGEAVDVMTSINVFDGYTDGSFNPTAGLTRGAAAKIICNLILGPTTAKALHATTAPYKDVPTTNTFAGYIAYCQKEGIISGYADGTFKPAAPLTGYAFMKMLLGALGYDAAKEGYTGANWSINVAKQAIGIGLNNGIDEFNGIANVTREQAALYAFNMIQSDLVEYPDDTTISVGDTTITTSGNFKSVQWGSSADRSNNIKADNYVQFAERFFNKLKKEAATDDFAQPATKWTNNGEKIGVYVDDASANYAKNVTTGTIYNDLGMTMSDDNAKVYYNGVPVTDVKVSRNNAAYIADSVVGQPNYGLVADGSVVNVYYDSEHNDVTICVIDVYAGEIASVNKTASAPFVMVTPHSTVKNRSLGTVTINGKFETSESFTEEQIVLFTYSQSANAIVDVKPMKSVEGNLTKYIVGKSLTLGETDYKYSKNIAYGFGVESDMKTKADYIVYTDDNGLALFVDEQEFNANEYAFVMNAQTASNLTFGKDQAILAMSDGTIKTVATDDDYTNLIGQIVLFRGDDKNVYTLRTAPNSHFNGTTGDTAAAAKAAMGPVTSNSPAMNGTTGVATNGATNFKMSNSNAKISVNGSTDIFANSESVFVVATWDSVNNKPVYNAYVGIKNAPTIMSDNPTTSATETSLVEAFYYLRGNNILAFAFIDATNAYVTSGKRDVVFLAGDTGLNGLVNAADGTQYYLYNAVVGGEITTLKVDPNAFVGAGDKNANYVLQNPQYNNKGIVTNVSAVNASDYTVVNQYTDGNPVDGIWKLSGAYTIGLGGTSASASTRYTVSTNAQIFYTDKDGKITKLGSVNNIVSDSNDKVIALLDMSTGDLAYIFIQEIGHDSSDNATNNTPGVVSAMTYVSGSVNVTASKAGNYTVSVYVLSAGQYVKAADYTVNVASDGGSGSVAIGNLTAGTAKIVCGNFTILA